MLRNKYLRLSGHRFDCYNGNQRFQVLHDNSFTDKVIFSAKSSTQCILQFPKKTCNLKVQLAHNTNNVFTQCVLTFNPLFIFHIYILKVQGHPNQGDFIQSQVNNLTHTFSIFSTDNEVIKRLSFNASFEPFTYSQKCISFFSQSCTMPCVTHFLDARQGCLLNVQCINTLPQGHSCR